LDFGQSWVGDPFAHELAGEWHPLEFGDDGLGVVFELAVEVDEVAVEVVEDFDGAGLFGEEEGGSACEGFDEAGVRGKGEEVL